MTRRIEIYADGADLKTMAALAERCAGCTTNPSLMRKAGITDYRKFAREVLAIWQGKPVSFEVLADDLPTMERQALEIAGWGENVYVKIPIMTGEPRMTIPLVSRLADQRIKVNVTAVFTTAQAAQAIQAIGMRKGIVSVFAGRIADAGDDAARTVIVASALAASYGAHILWASARQAYSVIEAERAGADIITLTPDLIAKLDGFGRDLEQYSLETVRQFVKDAEGITL